MEFQKCNVKEKKKEKKERKRERKKKKTILILARILEWVAWRIPLSEEPGKLQSLGSESVGLD